MNLTPAKKVALRRKVQSLVAEAEVQKAFDWCVAKHKSLKGLVDPDTIVMIFKETELINYHPPVKEIVEIKADEKETDRARMHLVDPQSRKFESSLSGITLKGDDSTSVPQIQEGGIVNREVAKIFEPKYETPYPIEIQKKLKEENKKMNLDFWESQEDPDSFAPFLKVKTKVTYTLELIDPSEEARIGVDSYGHNQFILNVILTDIEPKAALKDTDNEGRPLYVLGQEYAYPIKAKSRHLKRFKEFLKMAGSVETFKYKRIGTSFQTDYEFSV